jgi:hypothetical protein
MATQVEEPSLDDELLDRLLAGRGPKTVFESGGLLGELKKALAQRMLYIEGTSIRDATKSRLPAINATGTTGGPCSRPTAR